MIPAPPPCHVLSCHRALRRVVVPVWAAPATSPPGASHRLGTDVVPVFQAVRLEADARKPDYTRLGAHRAGRAKAGQRLRAPRPGHRDQRRLPHRPGRGRGGAPRRRRPRPARRDHGRPAPAGRHVLEIEFANEYDTQATGLYKVVVGGESYLFTQFEADDARQAFPCWDEPAFKIPYQLTVVVPEGHTAVSNTPPASDTVQGRPADGRLRPHAAAAVLPGGPGHGAAGVRAHPGDVRAGPGGDGEGRVRAGRRGGADHSAPARGPGALLRPPLPLREARPHRGAGVLAGGHGERRGHHLPRQHPAPRCPRRQRRPAAHAGGGQRPRAGPHVVRRPGHHGVVGRPVAERVLRLLDGGQGGGRGLPRVPHGRRHRAGHAAGHEHGRPAHHARDPPARRRPRQPAAVRRRAGLPEGAGRAHHDRELGRARGVPQGRARLPGRPRMEERGGRGPVERPVQGGGPGRGGRAGHVPGPARRAPRHRGFDRRQPRAPLAAAVRQPRRLRARHRLADTGGPEVRGGAARSARASSCWRARRRPSPWKARRPGSIPTQTRAATTAGAFPPRPSAPSRRAASAR